ncbi:MAG: hypothetical protein NVSMB21_10670 [Vulcanimicrobiaceae bacterium]
MQRFPVAAIGFAFVAFATGCSGGGGGSTPATRVGAAPTLPPVTTTTAPPASAAAANRTIFSVQSVPAGLAVTVDGGTTANGVTPLTVTPNAANAATRISIAPSNGNAPYVFLADQRGDGNRTVLYDQSADTSGSIGTISPSAVQRRSDAARAAVESDLPRVFPRGAAGRPAYSATRLVVRYRAAALASGARGALAIERDAGIERGVDVGPGGGNLLTRIVDVPRGTAIEALAERFRSRGDVASATPERLYYKQNVAAVTPNDTRYNNYEQWSLFEINIGNAWGYTTGSAAVPIAIVDTGADFAHPNLSGKIAFAESVLSGVVTTGNAAAQDTDGHGTNVASIAAANTNDNFSYAGTGFNSSLQVYKVFSDGTAANKYSTSANSGDVTQAIYDAVAHGAKVINLSLGTCQSQGTDPMQRDAVSFALSRGVVVVAAAGNERSGSTDPTCSGTVSTVDFPAAYDGVIAVGASALDDSAAPMVYGSAREKVASYSNSGPGLTLVAPGGDPTSADTALPSGSPQDLLHWIAGLNSSTVADPAMQCKNKSECRALWAGTSEATPFVSGVAALMFAANGGLSPAQIKTTLMATARDIGDPNEGAGRLDAYRALAAVKGDPNPPSLPTNANFVAFAYVPNGTNAPAILDVTYPTGVPVASNGTFRIADIPATAAGYKIGVWSDTNGDGRIDAGDFFGASTGACSAAAPCASAANIVVHPVAAGFIP